LETLQFALRSGVGALKAALGLPEPVEERELALGAFHFLEDTCFAYFHADQLPLGDSHLVPHRTVRSWISAPIHFQIVAKLIEFLTVFARQHNGAGAKSVTEGVHADSRLSFGGLGASRVLRIATIGLELLDCCHNSHPYQQSQIGSRDPDKEHRQECLWYFVSLITVFL
jgi:hypothetical protein